jgi:peptidyl-prolyl cis-trans isomerase A (cyclophilin A)
MSFTSRLSPIALCFAVVAPLGCEKTPPEPAPGPVDTSTAMPKSATPPSPTPAPTPTPTPTPTPSPTPTAPPPTAAKPVASVTASADDPLHGVFTLEDATKGLAGKGSLVAEIKTDLGTLSCDLFDDKAPITVANFIGLARGIRPWKNPSGEWVKKPGYDGTTFHRVIKGFMIQGGDPQGTGAGEPGYVIPDEIWSGAAHDKRGLLCMANRGKNTNGMQFFITDGAPRHLDGGYTIFGQCRPDDLIEKLASVATHGDRAVNPTKIQKVTIKREAAKAQK